MLEKLCTYGCLQWPINTVAFITCDKWTYKQPFKHVLLICNSLCYKAVQGKTSECVHTVNNVEYNIYCTEFTVCFE